MTKLTIAAAAKRAGVSSTTFNNRYVKTELIAVIEEKGKKHVGAAALTKLLAESKKKAVVKTTLKPATKRTTKPKISVVRMTEVEKLKLQVKRLKADFKAVTTENELLQKQNESLSRKNNRLTKKPATPRSKPSAKAKTKTKTNTRKKPIPLNIPDSEEMPEIVKHMETQQETNISRREYWVDKWWNSF